MSDAPEQIWADPDHWIEGPPLSDLASQGYTEYIRADHVDALLKAEREKALHEAAAICPTAIKSYDMLKPGKPNQFASREAQIVAKGFARLIEEDILALISKDKTDE